MSIGIVLSGGGARGAYQAGVVRALAEMVQSEGIKKNPFKVITGVSAGAINAVHLATKIHDFDQATQTLCDLWRNLHPNQVFKTDSMSMSLNAFRWLRRLSSGGLDEKRNQVAGLLNTEPLREFLEKNLHLDQIQKNIDAGVLDAVSLTALDYSTATGVNFAQARSGIPMWERNGRIGKRATLSIDHVMASSAIPVFFPPVSIGERTYGDGSLRNSAPLSSALHLGAKKLVVVGVRKERSFAELSKKNAQVTVGRILSVVINAVLMDAIEMDIERLTRINSTVEIMAQENREKIELEKIDFEYVRPSEDIGELAKDFAPNLPKTIRYLMAGLGSAEQSSELFSYLLFEPKFCQRLIEMGYKDCKAHQNRIVQLLQSS